MFSETRLTTSYFQQMTLCSEILKIIHIPPQKWSGVWIILGLECDLFWNEVLIIFIILGAKYFS